MLDAHHRSWRWTCITQVHVGRASPKLTLDAHHPSSCWTCITQVVGGRASPKFMLDAHHPSWRWTRITQVDVGRASPKFTLDAHHPSSCWTCITKVDVERTSPKVEFSLVHIKLWDFDRLCPSWTSSWSTANGWLYVLWEYVLLLLYVHCTYCKICYYYQPCITIYADFRRFYSFDLHTIIPAL